MDAIPQASPDPAGSDDLGGGLVPSSVGTLNLRPEVVEGFVLVREKHHQLQGLLHQVMRRVALPQCREIGELLITVRGYYAPGSKGPGSMPSRFFADATATTGLAKSSLHNYIQIAQNWHRLIDYMADLPEGATPITSLRGALEAIRAMNRPLSPAGGGEGVIDTDAQEVAEGADPLVAARGDDLAARRAELAASYVRPAAKARASLSALGAVRGLPLALRDRIEVFSRELGELLVQVEAALAESVEIPEPRTTNLPRPVTATAGPVNRVTHVFADYGGEKALCPDHPTADGVGPADPSDGRMVVLSDEWIENPGRPDQQLVAVGSLSEEQTERLTRSPLAAKYPKTREGLEALQLDIANATSGAALGRELGVSPQAVSSYLKALKKTLGVN